MNPSLEREALVFNEARRLRPDGRAAYLKDACAGDSGLRRAVEELLEADVAHADFLPELATESGACSANPIPSIQTASRVCGQPGDTIDRYKLLEKLGEGGFGVVYVAEQTEPVKRRVALKIIKLGMDTRQVVARFAAERQALALMDHPNIARVLDAGATVSGRPFFVMELVHGIRITDFCDRNNLSMRERLDLFVQVCRAVQHAHQKGIIHRDIKPSNVLVTRHDGAPVPKIIDFGIAKATIDNLLTDKTPFTTSGQCLGTPAYMSPEQAELRGLDIDTRADIYALGVLLYELLTGTTPFDLKELLTGGLDEMRRIIRDKEPVRPSGRLSAMTEAGLTRVAAQRHTDAPKLVHSIRGDLDWIVMKALEKDRSRRYESANELAMDVQRHLRVEVVQARQTGRVYRFQKLVRRHKFAVVAGASVALTLMLGLGATSWLLLKEKQAHRRAIVAEGLLRHGQYTSDMLLTAAALDEGNRAQAFELLSKQKPAPGQADLRGFEWRHLWHRSRGDYAVALPVHEQVVGAMAFSPDARLLATWCWDNTVRIWDLQSRANILNVDNASSLGGFSADGGQFIVGRQDGSLSEYRLRGAVVTKTALLENAGDLVALAANGKSAVTIDVAGSLKVWNLQTGKLKCALPEPVHRRLDSSWGAGIAIAPQGDLLAIVEESKVWSHPDEGISIWNLDTGKKLSELTEQRQIRCLQFSPDGKTLAVGDGGGFVNGGGDKRGEDECSIWCWDMNSFGAGKISVGTLPVLSLAFSSRGETLASGSSDGAIKLWDTATLTLKQRDFRGQIGAVWALAISPEGQQLASGSRNQTVKIWDLSAEARLETISGLDSREWGNFCFSADSKLMAAGCADQKVRVWEVETSKLRRALPGASYAAGFSPDGRLLTSSKDEVPKWWDLSTVTATPILAYPQKLEGAVACVDLSPDRHTAALGFKNGSIQLLDIESQRVIATVRDTHPGGVDCLAFSRAGDLLVSGGRDKSVALWAVQTHEKLETFSLLNTSAEHKGSVCAVAVSADEKLLASGCSAGTIKFWSPDDRLSKSLKTVAYHESVIRTLCFSPDNMTLASGSEDNTVKLWNAQTYQQVASFTFESHVRLVQFSPDGNTLAVVTDSGQLHLLRASPMEQADAELAAFSK